MSTVAAPGLLVSAPEQKLHAVEARIEQAASEGGASPEQLVEWRQECLALAQLACRADTGTPLTLTLTLSLSLTLTLTLTLTLS